MARENRFWGAERIRGELLKLGLPVAKRTIQKYMRAERKGTSPGGQNWPTFLQNHAHEIWACDFVQTYDALLRQIFAFVIVKHGTREVVHQAVTYHPTQEWTAQQLHPNMNPICERFFGSLRSECLDHVLLLGQRSGHSEQHELGVERQRSGRR